MRHFILLIVILSTSCVSAPSKAPANRQPAWYGDELAARPDVDLTFSELEKILEENKFSRIDQLLAYLSEHKPEFMSHYVLGYASRSIQGSSKKFPRAIVFGEKGKFIITFNGHRKQDAYDMLETVQFNEVQKRFEYREIQFNDLRKVPEGKPYLISAVGGPDGKCFQCHTNSRPIWEAYPVWPGFYGADDNQPMEFSNRGHELKMKASPKVTAEWKQFYEKDIKKNRYKHLKPMAKSLIFLGKSMIPNTDFTFLLYKYNFERIVRLIKENTDPSFRYAYIYATSCYAQILDQNRRRQNEFMWKKEPQMPYSDAFKALSGEFIHKYERVSLEHQIYRASRLVEDNQYGKQAFMDYWKHMYKEQKMDPLYIEKGRFNDFMKEFLLARGGYTMGFRIIPTFLVVAGMTEKYFPAAQVNTWGASLYEGVHKYDTGGGTELDWLADGIYDELFTPAEVTDLKDRQKADFFGFCEDIERKLPF